MGNEQSPNATTRVPKSSRPWSGFFLGLVFGIALAVVLQQSGVWPLDRLLLFGSAGLFALIGILLGTAGRERVGAFNTIAPLILSVALLGFGATGLAAVNERGELNGGCAVQATSDIDSTIVTDTSRQDPFEIDPEGSLSWSATSPAPITNHLWEIYVDIGGFQVVIANNDEPEPNTAENLENTGDVADLSAYVEEVSNYAGVELIGVFLVGGDIEGDGGACDGFGFVRLVSEPLTTVIVQIAAVIGALALAGLVFLTFSRTREVPVAVDEPSGEAAATAAAAQTGAAGSSGRHAAAGDTAAAAGTAQPGDDEGEGEAKEPDASPDEV
jgi:hypothetical protein